MSLRHPLIFSARLERVHPERLQLPLRMAQRARSQLRVVRGPRMRRCASRAQSHTG